MQRAIKKAQYVNFQKKKSYVYLERVNFAFYFNNGWIEIFVD